MGFFGILLTIVGIVVTLMINGIVALKMSDIAKIKGYEDKNVHAFDMCFWLGFIGWIYIAMLPNLVLLQQNQGIMELLKENMEQNNQ